MKPTKPRSLAEQADEARKWSVLLNSAYLYTTARGTLRPSGKRNPKARPELLAIFEELVESAAKYKKVTGRHLPILGELGELFAEIMFGIERHDPMTQGSDGRLGDDFVEVKTITPDKKTDKVQVKRAGNFVNLVVVKITDDFQFGARMVHRRILKKGRGEFDEISWDDMIAGEPDLEIHRNFPIRRSPPPEGNACATNPSLEISNYLNEVRQDWERSRGRFPRNVFPALQWPIPFFGNPMAATVATVGVNPSSTEFEESRDWRAVQSRPEWKKRLRDYFKTEVPPHEWFEPWRTALPLLGVSYQEGTASHFDVSYRATRAMFANPLTDRKEFRQMVENDAAWFFKLLLLCPNLRLLLTFGPIVGVGGQPESLFGFLVDAAPKHGFRVLPEEGSWQLWHEPTGKVILVHDADTPDEKCVTCRVVKNLHAHRNELRRRLRE